MCEKTLTEMELGCNHIPWRVKKGRLLSSSVITFIFIYFVYVNKQKEYLNNFFADETEFDLVI